MPLLDHFHPPLSVDRFWESLHARWAVALADQLERHLLPEGYFAEVQVHVGGRFEVDIAAFERSPIGDGPRGGGTAVAEVSAPIWAPPETDLQLPAIYPDSIEMLVYSTDGGPRLVGAVELVSPGNKDRPEARRAFAAKCASYLQDGVGLVIVDIVANRRANLHDELVGVLGLDQSSRMPGGPPLYATSYRPVRRPSDERIDVWLRGLVVGEPLPILPLALRGGPCLPLDLEVTYSDLIRHLRLA